MSLVAPARVELSLGYEITKKLNAALSSYGDDVNEAFAHAAEIIVSALEGSPEAERESNAATIIEFLRGEMVARGFPTSAEALAILAEKSRVDAANDTTSDDTDDMIFRQTFISHYVMVDSSRTPAEEEVYMRRLNELRAEATRRFGTHKDLERRARDQMQGH